MRLFRWLALATILALLAAAGAGWWAATVLQRPHRGYDGRERILEIPEGSAAVTILERLEAEGVLADAWLTRLYLVYVLGDPTLKAGEYRFAGPLTARQVVERLIRGEVVTHRVTVLEGLTLEETAAALAGAGFGDRGTFLAEMSRPERIADLDPAATDLEGYLFPDTYAFARRTPESEIVDSLVGTFRERLREDLTAAGFDSDRHVLRDLVTLASIVEKEAALDEERPIIAGVYRNRLERGIALYADPTIIYAIKKLGRWDGDLRRADLELDSPYNTYRHAGLPPGPICSPGLASLIAALAPADVPYLYFVSRNDGSHVFARTLAEHNRNVARWQKRYWRERRARDAEEAADP